MTSPAETAHIPQADSAASAGVTVWQYGLRAPLNWDRDVDDELWRMNAFWNKLVEIERTNRARYREIIATSPAKAEVQAAIETLKAEQAALVGERAKRRAVARSKVKADTGEIDGRLKAIKADLRPLFDQSKSLSSEAREQQKPLLDVLEFERREQVKLARQNSGCFWSNYNAVLESYGVARVRAMKAGAELRFKRFGWEGRLVNQIQGGLSADDLFACKHSQVGIRLYPGRQDRGILYVTAFTGAGESGRFRRNVEFPVILHRPFPAGAIIKSVSVSLRRTSATVGRRPLDRDQDFVIERGFPEYQVNFTCTFPREETEYAAQAAGINFGWKKVADGLRVATAVYSDGSTEHLVLPRRWLDLQDRVAALISARDETANEMHAILSSAFEHLPAWRESGPFFEGLSSSDHRLLSAIRLSPVTPRRAMDALAWRIKDINLPLVSPELAAQLEAWRKANKSVTLESDNLRIKLQRSRKDFYRKFAARLAGRCGQVVLDNLDLRAATQRVTASGDENELSEVARYQRQLASISELRSLIELAISNRGGECTRYSGTINHCHACGSRNLSGEVQKQCHACGALFDADENAGHNLLSSVSDPAASVFRARED